MRRIALIDGPLSPGHPAFGGLVDSTGGAVFDSPAGRHAAAMASAIVEGGADVSILSIPVFPGPLTTTAAGLARALTLAAEDDAGIIHCSLGLARPDAAVTDAVARLIASGRIVVASAPARGEPVFPAALPGVISVQGDARCGAGTWSRLGLPTADYGADPRLASDRAIGGASVAAAHLTGLIAALGAISELAARAALDAGASFHGREHRRA